MKRERMSLLENTPTSNYPSWLPWLLLILVLAGSVGIYFFKKIQQDRFVKKKNAEFIRLKKENEILSQFSFDLHSPFQMDKSLLQALITIKQFTNAHRGYINLFDLSHDYLYGIAEAEDYKIHPGYKKVFASGQRLPSLFTSQKPFIAEDIRHPDPMDRYPTSLIDDGNISSVFIQIRDYKEVFGFISLYFDKHQEWNNNQIDFFSSIGLFMGRFVNNISTIEKIRELAVLQERKQLSRELHDNFSQLINGISMRTEATRLSLAENDIAKIRDNLNWIESTANEAQTLLRSEMIGLRQIPQEESDLLLLIQECVDRYQRISNFQVLINTGDTPTPIFASIMVTSQFIRILQETLNNILRHANATEVEIRLNEYNHHLYVEIEDNGLGFNPSGITKGSLGLQIMQERVELIGGNLKIKSIPGQGTTVQVKIPLVPTLQGD